MGARERGRRREEAEIRPAAPIHTALRRARADSVVHARVRAWRAGAIESGVRCFDAVRRCTVESEGRHMRYTWGA